MFHVGLNLSGELNKSVKNTFVFNWKRLYSVHVVLLWPLISLLILLNSNPVLHPHIRSCYVNSSSRSEVPNHRAISLVLSSAGGSGSEDHAAHADLQDFEAGSSLDGPQGLRLHTEAVLPAGQTNNGTVDPRIRSLFFL